VEPVLGPETFTAVIKPAQYGGDQRSRKRVSHAVSGGLTGLQVQTEIETIVQTRVSKDTSIDVTNNHDQIGSK